MVILTLKTVYLSIYLSIYLDDDGPGLAALYGNANLEDSEDDEDFDEDGVEPGNFLSSFAIF
jgi:hypothetical protein